MPTEGARGRSWRAWLPVVAYVALIYTLSAQPNLASPFEFRNGDKLAHTLEYGGLGVLLANALRTGAWRERPLAAGLLALAIGMVIAGCDEKFQSFVPGRESSALDWLADVSGLIMGQLAYLAIRRE